MDVEYKWGMKNCDFDHYLIISETIQDKVIVTVQRQ